MTEPLPDPIELAGDPDTPAVLATAGLHHPLWLVEPGVAHAVRNATVRRILVDYRRFSSDGAAHGPVGVAGPAAPARTLNAADPPDHARLRGLAAPWFTRDAVDARVPAMVGLAKELFIPLTRRPSFDAVSEFASPFVLGVLAGVMGLPDGMEPQLRELADSITAPDGRSEVERARRELGELFAQVVAVPEHLDSQCLLRHLAMAERAGRLTYDELIAQCIVLVVAGSETSRNLLSAALLTLAEDQAALTGLADNPAGVAAFVEEALRYHSSVQAAVRFTTESVMVDEVQIPEHSPVFVWVSAANRDPLVHADPDTFDPNRTTRHLGFGTGIHSCLGAHLARAELAVALGTVADNVDGLRLRDDDVHWLASPLARGPARLRLTAR